MQNRDIYCIRLTNESVTQTKPKLLFIGNHHGRELISSELALYCAVNATASFGVNATMTYMLNFSEIYIIPALNPDGMSCVAKNEWHRKNAHPIDEDNDTRLDEDPPEDEDGDGYIEDLIRWDGSQWVFVRWEGTDNDSDGLPNEDWIGGVDLNRNYGYEWNASCYSGSTDPWAEDYRGTAPFSELETQALRDFALSQRFKYAVSFHSGSERIVYPWGYTDSMAPHAQVFENIAQGLSTLVSVPYQQSGQWYTTSGVWDDWIYGAASTLPFTCEIYTNSSAWQYELGPEPDTLWERGIFQWANPDPGDIGAVVQRWMPAFINITRRAIRIVGDVNGDEKVDVKDIYRIAKAYGSYPEHSRWDAICDLNLDFKVDIKDYYPACKNYGKWTP
jgi:carboxypeptidase T